jgi:hypothetical protein
MKKRLYILIAAVLCLAAIPIAVYFYNLYTVNSVLLIKEWNVQFKVPKDIRGDLTYEYQPAEHSADVEQVYLISKKLSQESEYCNQPGPGIAIHRRKSDNSQSADKYIDGYVYDFIPVFAGDSWCRSSKKDYPRQEDDPVWQKAKQMSEELNEAFKALEVVR